MIKTKATREEQQKASSLFNAYFEDPSQQLPFSFKLDGQKITRFDERFTVKRQETQGEKPRLTLEAKHESGLDIKVEAVAWPNYAAYEWTIWFSNTTGAESPLVSDILAADLSFDGREPVLHSFCGDDCVDPLAYAPLDIVLFPGTCLTQEPLNGRSSNYQFPYCRLDIGEGGAFIAVGWPGQWRQTFDARGRQIEHVQYSAGQAEFSSVLRPGETVRSPLMAFLWYDGRDEDRATNLWRRWFIDCNMRRLDGELMEPMTSGSTSWINEEMLKSTDENQIFSLNRYFDHGIKLDYWWMDAGWYMLNEEEPIDYWVHTGSWIVDRNRFPSGFKAISDEMARHGGKTLLWFEPERVGSNTVLNRYPEWIIDCDIYNEKPEDLPFKLMDMGNADFREWLVDRVDTVLTEGDISLYRQDFNIDPLSFWQYVDLKAGADRVGMCENRYVQGYLAYWDELIRRHPGMMLDSCASGGRRNDLETMRRSVPLHKTDSDYNNMTIKHGMHHSLYRWFPYFGTPVAGLIAEAFEEYALRTAQVPFVVMCYDIRREDMDFGVIRKYIDEWRETNGFYYDEYYMLTPWTNRSDEWIGWEFYNAEEGRGIAQIFRQDQCEADTMRVMLKGLDEGAEYRVAGDDVDIRMQGDALMNAGFDMRLDHPRKAQLLRITRQ